LRLEKKEEEEEKLCVAVRQASAKELRLRTSARKGFSVVVRWGALSF